MIGLVPKIQQFVVNSYNWHPRIRHFLLSDKGIFTVFFWCPWFKWAIVFANIRDLEIPAENLSLPQQTAVALTGLVWSRYATQIYPLSYNLLSVNFFMALTGLYQISRK